MTAVAKSLVGSDQCSCDFTQQKLPCEIVGGLENVTKSAEEDDLTLNVNIKASPRPTFVW